MMDNLEYLGIYKNQIDKVVEMCEGIIEDAGLDLEDLNEAALDRLKESPIEIKDITPAILSTYLSNTVYMLEEKMKNLGLEKDFEFDYFNDGYYSSISINNSNQSITDAFTDVLKDKFSFIPYIEDIIADARNSSTDIDDIINYSFNDIIDYINEKYDFEMEVEYLRNDCCLILNGAGRQKEKILDIPMFRDSIKNYIKTAEKIISEIDSKETEHT